MADSTPIMLAVAPNGARKSKADHPRLPVSALELAATAQECLAAGASMIHLHVRDLVPLLAAMPQGWPWAACAFGPAELRCVIAAALHGGDIRVGFENNLQLPSGETANSNAALVQATVAALSPLGFRAATCAEARRHLQKLSS